MKIFICLLFFLWDCLQPQGLSEGIFCPKWNIEPGSRTDTCILYQIPSDHRLANMVSLLSDETVSWEGNIASFMQLSLIPYGYAKVQPPKLSLKSLCEHPIPFKIQPFFLCAQIRVN